MHIIEPYIFTGDHDKTVIMETIVNINWLKKIWLFFDIFELNDI